MNDMPAQGQAVPAYFHPEHDAAEWARLAASGPAVVVANVADGPGLVREKSWAIALHDVRAAGSQVVGYVDTGYLGLTGSRTWLGSTLIDDWLEQILLDINTWYRLYGDALTGIFFDQVAESGDGASIAPVFRRLRDHVRQMDSTAVTVLNAGAALPEAFAGLADILVTFEGPCDAYLTSTVDDCFAPLTWRPDPSQTIWHIIHNVPDAARAAEVVALSRGRGAALVYVTDGAGQNPYSSLPSPHISAATTALTSASTRWRNKQQTGGHQTSFVSIAEGPTIDPNSTLISNPMLVRDDNRIEASADFVVSSSCRRVFLASRRTNVPRWWTGSSPQIAADWLIENNRLYAYAGDGTDWTWTPTGQVIFEALGSKARWRLQADVIGLGRDADAAAAFHVSAPGHREYSDVAVGRRATTCTH
jgi:hypothetical protein